MSTIAVGQHSSPVYGGRVFAIVDDGSATYALICQPEDMETDAFWYINEVDYGFGYSTPCPFIQLISTANGSFNTTDLNANDTTESSGSINHDLFVAYRDTINGTYEQSLSGVMVVENLSFHGFTDWFIPNKAQLALLIQYAYTNFPNHPTLGLNLTLGQGRTYITSTEGTSQALEVYAAVLDNSSAGSVAFTSISKTDFARIRAIRKIPVPPDVQIIDVDGTTLDAGGIQAFANTPIAVTTSTHTFNFFKSREETTIWYSSYIKFTSLATNTAAAVFGSIPGLIMVAFTNYAANGYPTYYYYTDAAYSSENTLTALTDGGVYRITIAANSTAYALELSGDLILNSAGSVGYDFSIVSGDSYMPWPVDKTVFIDSLFGVDSSSPDAVTSYTYYVCHTADMSASQWGSDGTLGTANHIGSGQNNTDLIVTANSGRTTAAKLSNDLSSTVSGTTYTDWFLPSQGEMERLISSHAQIAAVSQGYAFHATDLYWTSSEDGRNHATSYGVGLTSPISTERRLNLRSRPIRKVTSSTSVDVFTANFGGVVFRKEAVTASKITRISNDIGSSWIPTQDTNELTTFTPGNGYYIETTAAFTFSRDS